MHGISVITPTIPERVDLLPRCRQSVQALQNGMRSIEHIVVGDGPGCDADYSLQQRTGSSVAPIMVGQYMASCDWRIILPDDDYLWEDGLLTLWDMAIQGGYDFIMGLVGLRSRDSDIREWAWAGDPIRPGSTEGFLFHKRLLAIAHIEYKAWGGGDGYAGCDYVMLDKWVRAGARYCSPPVKLLVHREG